MNQPYTLLSLIHNLIQKSKTFYFTVGEAAVGEKAFDKKKD